MNVEQQYYNKINYDLFYIVSSNNSLKLKSKHKKKLTKSKTINTSYRLLLKGYNLKQVAEYTGWDERTITRWLEVDWNKAGIKPEYIREEVWASVCLLIEKVYILKQIKEKILLHYGKILTKKLINSIRYYYKKFTTKSTIHLQLQLPFSFII